MMNMKVSAVALLCMASLAMSKNMGSIQVKDYGEVWVVAPDWAAGSILVK